MKMLPQFGRRFVILLPVALGATLLAAPCYGQTATGGFVPPVVRETGIPDRAVSIVDFGAVPDGKTLNTAAFAKAIEAIVQRGGGKVVVPPGLWLTGPIRLKSNLDLHLEAGALVQFTTDYKQYPLVVVGDHDENAVTSTSPLSGENLENVAVTGRGVFDGGGNAWRPVKKNKLTDNEWKALTKSGGVVVEKGDIWWPSREAMDGGALVASLTAGKSQNPADYEPAHQYLRPTLLALTRCQRVLLGGVTFQNSPNWHLHPLLCENVTINDVTVRAPWNAQNSDALDLDSCRNVLVRGSSFDVGDDGICIKSGLNAAGRRRGVPTENVLIENCVVYHGHGGFTIGSEMSGGVRNVRLNNCVFMGTDTGLRFKSTRGRGGVVERIYVSNVRMIDVPGDAISFSMFYGGKAPTDEDSAGAPAEMAKIDEGTPQFRDFFLENITCRGAKVAASLRGLPEMPIRGIHMKNVAISANAGMNWTDAADIHLENAEIINAVGPVLQIQNTTRSSVDGLSYRDGVEAIIAAKGKEPNSLTVTNTDTKKAAHPVLATDGSDPGQIKLN